LYAATCFGIGYVFLTQRRAIFFAFAAQFMSSDIADEMGFLIVVGLVDDSAKLLPGYLHT
jgi:hypothetical protein